jgi:O-methyltransferase involved in polyketide biosynthesis
MYLIDNGYHEAEVLIMTTKNKFELNEIEKTMILPLWGRYVESKKNDPFLYDSKAIEIINQIDYDFSQFKKELNEYNALAWVIRAKTIDVAVKDFIKKHPKASIVNIGAGLDTTFERIDNGQLMWYDLDLPNAIDFRKNFIPETDRRKYIAKSVFDYSWFDDVTFSKENTILFIAGGVLTFFDEKNLKELFSKLSIKFPNSEIFFDSISKEGLEYVNNMMNKAGMKKNMLSWGINSGEEITKWNDKIKIVDEFSFYERITRKKEWSKEVVTTMDMCDKNKNANFHHLKFI